MKKVLLVAVLLVLTLAILAPHPSYAWSNGGYSSDPRQPKYGTHDWIAKHALDWLPDEEKQFIACNLAIYLYGTELPDNSKAPDGIGDTAKHHIYYRSNGELQDNSAADRAQFYYRESLHFLKLGDLSNGAKYAGVMSHYIADMAVFGHVMGEGTDWGPEHHHSDYEDYVNARTSDSAFNSYLHFDGYLGMTPAYHTALKLAYDTTFDSSGNGLTCVWMDQNYGRWSNSTFRNRCGQSLNLAVNYLADVLHTLWLEAGKPIPEFKLEFMTALILPIAVLLALCVLRVRLLHKRNCVR